MRGKAALARPVGRQCGDRVCKSACMRQQHRCAAGRWLCKCGDSSGGAAAGPQGCGPRGALAASRLTFHALSAVQLPAGRGRAWGKREPSRPGHLAVGGFLGCWQYARACTVACKALDSTDPSGGGPAPHLTLHRSAQPAGALEPAVLQCSEAWRQLVRLGPGGGCVGAGGIPQVGQSGGGEGIGACQKSQERSLWKMNRRGGPGGRL